MLIISWKFRSPSDRLQVSLWASELPSGESLCRSLHANGCCVLLSALRGSFPQDATSFCTSHLKCYQLPPGGGLLMLQQTSVDLLPACASKGKDIEQVHIGNQLFHFLTWVQPCTCEMVIKVPWMPFFFSFSNETKLLFLSSKVVMLLHCRGIKDWLVNSTWNDASKLLKWINKHFKPFVKLINTFFKQSDEMNLNGGSASCWLKKKKQMASSTADYLDQVCFMRSNKDQLTLNEKQENKNL